MTQSKLNSWLLDDSGDSSSKRSAVTAASVMPLSLHASFTACLCHCVPLSLHASVTACLCHCMRLSLLPLSLLPLSLRASVTACSTSVCASPPRALHSHDHQFLLGCQTIHHCFCIRSKYYEFLSSWNISEKVSDLEDGTLKYVDGHEILTNPDDKSSTLMSPSRCRTRRILEEHRDKCEAQGKYGEAEIAKKRLDELHEQ